MPSTYADERQTAYNDIHAAGVVGKIVRNGVPYNVPILILQYTEKERETSLIRPQDQKFMIPALGLPIIPDPEQDRVVIDDPDPLYASAVGDYQIVTTEPFHIGGVAIFYYLQVRR